MLYLKCMEYYELCTQEYIKEYSLVKRASYNSCKEAQLFKNYDYADDPSGPGKGLYSDMDKYKSVADFRKKKRSRRMKAIKKLKDHKLK